MHSLKALRLMITLLAIFMTPLSFGWAQSSTATLSGSVVDEADRVVRGVKITIQNEATSLKREVTSNESGLFAVPVLPPGNYTVTALSDGFAPVKINNVILNVNDERSLRIQLRVGSVGETITVVSNATTLKEGSTVATIIDRQFISNLPVNGRSLQTLIALSPGVVVTATTGSGSDQGQFSVNGQRANANYFTVDGVSANFGLPVFESLAQSGAGALPSTNIQGGFGNLASLDALQEFKIQTSSYAPEFGRSPGAQISLVTRSGENRYRGLLYEYFRNDIFDARDFFDLRKPPLRFNNFGGTFSGPVVLPNFGEGGPTVWSGKDRTFFFFSYEGQRFLLPQPTLTAVVPSLAARRNAPNEAARAILESFVLPNGPDILDTAGRSTGGAEYRASYSNPNTSDAWSIRLDHNFNQRFSLFGRYNNAPSFTQSRATGNLSAYSRFVQNTETLTLGSTQVFTSRLVNEVRANASRQEGQWFTEFDGFDGGKLPPESIFIPVEWQKTQRRFGFTILNIAGASGIGGFPSTTLGDVAQNQARSINVVDNLSYSLGSHQLKFGGDYRWYSPIQASNDLILTTQFNGISDGTTTTANVYNGIAASLFYSRSIQYELLTPNFSAYAQDTWKVSPRVTFTFGTRWEVNPAATGQSGKKPFTLVSPPDLTSLNQSNLQLAPEGTPYYETSYSKFAPRVGVAYQVMTTPGRELMLRAGWGMFYDLGQGQFGRVSWPYTFTSITANQRIPIQNSVLQFPPVNATPSPTNRASLTVAAPDYTIPRTYQWNLTLEQSLGKDQTLSVGYVAAAGRKLQRTLGLFLIGVNPTTGQPLQPNYYYSANYTSVTLVTNESYSDYHSLQVQFNRRLARGLQGIVSYTWAHSTDDSSSDASISSPGFIIPPSVNHGPSNFDVRHAFSAGFTYELPGPEWDKFTSAVLRNWSFNGIFFARTGLPYDVGLTESYAVGGVSTFRRLNVVPGAPQYIDDEAAPGGFRLNPAAFTPPPFALTGQPPIFTQGTLGRNALRGPGAWQLDIGLHRRFNLTEQMNLEFRFEVFNILNHPNFYIPSFRSFSLNSTTGAITINSNFGRSTATLARGLGGGGNTGGFNPLFQTGGPRSMQFALRFSF